MTPPAIIFATPLLLAGVLAAGIPIVLHLLSNVRAQEIDFPTLRFLRLGMQKTARRRRIQNWLLLALRAGLLGVLALAVAEPISRATGGWMGGRRYAAVVVLDNSLSMAARNNDTTRLGRAQAQASALLGGEDRPALAALLTAQEAQPPAGLSSNLEPLRQAVHATEIHPGEFSLAQQVERGLELLAADTSAQKALYILSDLQRTPFEELAAVTRLAQARDVHLMVVHCAAGEVNNVGLAALEITGQRVVNQTLEVTATLANSSPAGRVVDVSLHVEGQPVGQPIRKSLAAMGKPGDSSTVRFHYRLPRSGSLSGEVRIAQADDLLEDNVRRFSLWARGRVEALVVRGPASPQASALDPAMMLQVALDPYADPNAAWSIAPRTVEADQLTDDDFDGADAAFFCEVPAFSPEQARAIAAFVRRGGTAVFFCGPDTQADHYNKTLIHDMPADGGLLPAPLGAAVGEVGVTAQATAVEWVDAQHPYFQDLYENPGDYLSVLVQRRLGLGRTSQPPHVLMRLAGGEPLMVAKPYGAGRVVLCATTASPRWSNLPATGLFLPMVARMSLLSRQDFSRQETCLAGREVRLTPTIPRQAAEHLDGASIVVTLPAAGTLPTTVSLELKDSDQGPWASFSQTQQPGHYAWRVVQAEGGELAGGAFAVNADGEESKLASITPADLRQRLAQAGVPRVYIADDLAGVTAAAADDAQGRNWWDLLLAAVILMLVCEALVANRRKSAEPGLLPAHLTPKASP